MQHPVISLIVPLYNHLTQTQAMLASLHASLPPGLACEVIVVDDGSTDGTREWLAQLTHPAIQRVLNPCNLGYAKAMNAGLARARGALVALLNNDLVLSPGWLEPMLEALSDPSLQAGLVGNVQTRIADGTLDHAGIHMTDQGKLAHVQDWPGAGQVSARVFAVTGACCLVRRELLDSVGGLNEGFVNGAEDIDLCQKIKAKGFHIAMAYRSVVAHHVSLSRDRASPQNEVNSRHLQACWRSEFKRELARVWHARLTRLAPPMHHQGLDGQWRTDVLATPHALAQLIAENVLQQEEDYWARTLDQIEPHAMVADRCLVQGLSWSPLHNGHVLGNTAWLQVSGLRSLRNFYVCGRTLPTPGAGPTVVTLSANGLQDKSVTLPPEVDVNVGLLRPLILPGLNNCFQVVTTAPLLVSHFVLDDQRVPVG